MKVCNRCGVEGEEDQKWCTLPYAKEFTFKTWRGPAAYIGKVPENPLMLWGAACVEQYHVTSSEKSEEEAIERLAEMLIIDPLCEIELDQDPNERIARIGPLPPDVPSRGQECKEFSYTVINYPCLGELEDV